MEFPASAVVVCESNRTRADLYELWLDDREVRQTLTRSQFADAFDAGVAVLVLDLSFGEGGAEPVSERVESTAPHCRVLGIRGRSRAEPDPSCDRELERPVFEPDLAECVETLFHRANYHLLLDLYYRTTVAIATREWRTDGDPENDERYGRLRDRAERLQDPLNRLRERMTDEDVHAVLRGFTVEDVPDGESDASIEAKYRPDECSRCGLDWNEPIDGRDPVAQLGAYVWRCVNCGHVDMRADPSHQSITSYK
ncbi:response regulator receiver protein [Halorubrum yunnanense]|uniref:Response regulator receiver protein n=1 Tax=Halorubrum yunnanense TaxID=1526162 RepID=A0ABD5YFC6_9EURY|nr:response regulator receiver protein [Halorubrum yunnanense]